MTVTFETYARVVLENPTGRWELAAGRLRNQPPTTVRHEILVRRLTALLSIQLNWREWSVGLTRLRVSVRTYFVPNVAVVPMTLVETLLPDQLEVYAEPVPLVAEVWLPFTGDYDVDEKLREYQSRGDLEIWRIQPYDRTLTAWRRQPEGSYTEETFRGGIVRPVVLPNVSIDLNELFD